MAISPRRVLTAGVLLLAIAAAAYGGLLLVRGPHPIFVHIRWAPTVDETAREQAERRFSLSQPELLDGRTWGYTLNSASSSNIRDLVTDARVEDTQDIDRNEFRASPTAEARPYPDSFIAQLLWGVTALSLFLGLTTVSIALIAQSAPISAALGGDPKSRIPNPNQTAAPAFTLTHGISLLSLIAFTGVCFLAARTMDLRVDEGNHLSQIQRYAEGSYETTTAPGGGFHAVAATFAWLTGHSSKESIRLFVVLIAAATIFTFWGLVTSWEPRASTQRTLQFMFFPLLFPFWFLIYTDVFAILLLLLSLLTLTWNRFAATGVLGILSVAVRQTYVVWLALLGVWTILVNLGRPLAEMIRRVMTFVIGGGLFLLFVAVNGGVAMGDRSSHPDMELHTENLLFMLVCFFVLFLPIILSKLPQIARLPLSTLIGVPLGSAALFFGTFSVDHPYNVATQVVFLRNEVLHVMTSSLLAGLAATVAVALAVLSLFVIRLRQPIHYLVYPFAALSVLPVWLIEQRYYLPAFVLFMLFRESSPLPVERTLVATNGALALFLFAGVVQGWFFL